MRRYSLGFDPVPQPAMTRSPIGRCTIGPAPSEVGKGLASGFSLVHRALTTLIDWAGHLQADSGRQSNCVFSDILVRLTSGLREQCDKN
jgi:hypothetical protein